MGRRKIGLTVLALSSSIGNSSGLDLWGSKTKVTESDAQDQSTTTKKGSSSTSSNGKDNYHFEQSNPLPGQEVNTFGQPTYGVDVSFPMHHTKLSNNYAWLPHNVDPEHNPIVPDEYVGKNVQYLGNKQAEYDEFIKGCDEHYGASRGYSACQTTEDDRVDMTLRQPQVRRRVYIILDDYYFCYLYLVINCENKVIDLRPLYMLLHISHGKSLHYITHEQTQKIQIGNAKLYRIRI